MSDKVRGATLTNKVSLLGGGREFQARRPVHQVRFLFDDSSKRRFSCASFYIFDKSLVDLGEVGLSQLLCVDWLLA